MPGIPWWGAILVAATAAAIGFAFDAGSGAKELSAAFAVCYVTGCVLAVLAVRQSGLFSAVIQPPLILFVAVPAAYFVFHGSTITSIKDTLINCGYPLIERFPLMFFTSATVLVIGAVRWYLGTSARRGAASDAEPEVSGRVKSKLATAETTTIDAVEATPRRRRERAADRPSHTAAAMAEEAPRRPRKATRTAPAAGASRSRHARPPEPDLVEPPPDRRRRRPQSPGGPPVEPPAEPRRRGAPREPRRNLPPLDGRSSHERPERPERRRRPSGYEPYEPYDSFEPRTTNGASGTHHPVSRVRYRGDDDAESRTEYRNRPPRPRHADADAWEYDI